MASGAVTCILQPELTEGPYYIDDAKLRRNITEGKAGAKLMLRSGCGRVHMQADQGAAVDVWHADAGACIRLRCRCLDQTFLRGVQRTDANGLAVFQTIYPGWYGPRECTST